MILLGSEIKEFNNYKIFLENHYRDLSINRDSKSIQIRKDYTTLFSTNKFSELTDFMQKELLYHKIFCQYNQLSCVDIYLSLYENSCITSRNSDKGWSGYGIEIPNIVKKLFPSSGDVCTFVKDNFGYSLSKLIPYICPKCENGFCYEYSHKVGNGVIYTCSKCKHEIIDLF